VHTDLSTRRVLVTEYVEGLGFDEIAPLDDPQRDRIGEIVFRFFFGLLWREHTVAGDPHPGRSCDTRERISTRGPSVEPIRAPVKSVARCGIPSDV
jgi:hypothetical protein